MIGTIRKHSKWLWLIIIVATVISFVFWGAAPSRLGNGPGGGSGDFGTIYGHKITQQEYIDARNQFYVFSWFHSGEWPDKKPGFTEAGLQKDVYVRLMLDLKANALGIQVGQDALVTTANEMLRSIGRNGQAVPIAELEKQVLQPKGLTAQDFENFVRQYLVIDQLQSAIGLTGELFTPQEAADAYQRENQEVSAQMVAFSATNYLSSVTASPAAIGQFYTNYLAEYRLPNRVQVTYVAFELSNYLAAAEQQLLKTNLNEQVDALYLRYGASAFPDAKTPADAKTQIRSNLIRQGALIQARKEANNFANDLFNLDPAKPENLATIAKKYGLPLLSTEPFAAESGPEEFSAPPGFVKAAFSLTPDEPLVGPVAGPDALYVLALTQRLPSEIPPLDQIQSRVARDYQWIQGVMLAQHAGTNFVQSLKGMTADHSFASLCVAAGLTPQELPAFSLSTKELPGLAEGNEMNQIKQAVFSTPVGKTSGFVPTRLGGFIVYVQSRLPLDQSRMNTDLPQFVESLRRQRVAESFNQWVNAEASHQLTTTPVFATQFGAGAAK